jgi:hypothetical protein
MICGKSHKIALCAISLVALESCQHTRYTPVYCVTPQQLERLKANKPSKVRDQLTGQADEDLKKVAGRLVRVEAWGDGLLTVLGGCVDPKA